MKNWLKKSWAWVAMIVGAGLGALMFLRDRGDKHPVAPPDPPPPPPNLPPVEVPKVNTSPSDTYAAEKKPPTTGEAAVIDDLNARHK
jgi:hypothetical protein